MLQKTSCSIVDKIVKDNVDMTAPNPALPRPEHLARSVNYQRHKIRPDEPKEKNFKVFLELI